MASNKEDIEKELSDSSQSLDDIEELDNIYEFLSERQRVDLTKLFGLGKNERRLDTFSRLLAAKTTCTAVMLCNKKLYIAANEINNSSKVTDAVHISISKIIEYFSNVIDSKQNTLEEEKIFLEEICSKTRLSKNNIRFSLPANFSENIIKKLLANHGQGVFTSICNKWLLSKKLSFLVLADAVRCRYSRLANAILTNYHALNTKYSNSTNCIFNMKML